MITDGSGSIMTTIMSTQSLLSNPDRVLVYMQSDVIWHTAVCGGSLVPNPLRTSTSTVFIFIQEKACERSVKVHLEYCYNSGQRARGGKSALRKTLKCEK
jgi:hypothetical protein